jgi:hypothetical protein
MVNGGDHLTVSTGALDPFTQFAAILLAPGKLGSRALRE